MWELEKGAVKGGAHIRVSVQTLGMRRENGDS